MGFGRAFYQLNKFVCFYFVCVFDLDGWLDWNACSKLRSIMLARVSAQRWMALLPLWTTEAFFVCQSNWLHWYAFNEWFTFDSHHSQWARWSSIELLSTFGPCLGRTQLVICVLMADCFQRNECHYFDLICPLGVWLLRLLHRTTEKKNSSNNTLKLLNQKKKKWTKWMTKNVNTWKMIAKKRQNRNMNCIICHIRHVGAKMRVRLMCLLSELSFRFQNIVFVINRGSYLLFHSLNSTYV